MTKYVAKNGFNIPDGKGGEIRVEIGETVELTEGQADALKDSIEKPRRRVERGADL